MTHRSSLPFAVLMSALLATTVVDGAAAQTDSASLAAQTDQLFAQWDKPDSPGCVCAVMRDGEVMYSRAFGMANLELDVPLTPQSVFYIASIAKQFTAASIALLALRGQLSLDDDVRTYVPEMADFGETITIRHLVHHTSGIRDHGGLRRLSGRIEDYFDNARTLALLSRQRTLNFRPGEEHLYSNSGYVLLGEIVKRVSGTSLREFAEENIFGPLGMANTEFDDDYRTIIKRRVASYRQGEQGGLQRHLQAHRYTVGPGGLLATAEDLLRWNRNFDAMTVGGPHFIDLMLTRGTLNDGDTIDYAFGLTHGEYRDLKTVGHGGSHQGFRTTLRRFPEQRLSVAVLCNLGTIDRSGLARRVADIYLRDVFEAEATEDESRPAPKAVSVSTGELQKVTGHYWNATDYLARRIYVQADTLSLFRSPGDESKLVPLGNDRFYVLDVWRDQIVSFTSPTPEQPRQMIVVVNDGEPSVYDAVEPASPSRAELEGYLGTYFSEELDYEQVLRITSDSLSMWDPRTWVEFALRPVVRDVFQAREAGTFTFSRDGQGRVVGFTVDTPRSRNMQFVRR